MNIKDVMMGFAGAYNALSDHAKMREKMGLDNNSCIWMVDDEGLHVIDLQTMLAAMDAFLTVLEQNDRLVEIKNDI